MGVERLELGLGCESLARGHPEAPDSKPPESKDLASVSWNPLSWVPAHQLLPCISRSMDLIVRDRLALACAQGYLEGVGLLSTHLCLSFPNPKGRAVGPHGLTGECGDH